MKKLSQLKAEVQEVGLETSQFDIQVWLCR